MALSSQSPRRVTAGKPWLNRTVLGAGCISALGDFCYETTTVVLPGFLAVLGIAAAFLDIIEGVADRFGHRKRLVMAGHALTPLGQICIALATGWPLILSGRFVA